MNSKQLIDKWARKKLKEYGVPRPDEDNLISVTFDTKWGGGCETCAYQYDVVELMWDFDSFTVNESYDLGEILTEMLDGVDTSD